MRNRKSNLIAVDLDLYAIYLHIPSETLLAVDLKHMQRINALVAQHGDFSTVPATELITAIVLDVKDSSKGYELTPVTRDWKVQEVYPQWVYLGGGR